MSRRDTIIVAVLFNTGLLAALFMMAMNTDMSESIVPTEVIAEVVVPEPEPVKHTPTVPEPPKKQAYIATRDEIDEVLKHYASANTPPVTVIPSVEEEYVEVTVKRGDYLEKIARANGVTVSAIMRANDLPNARIDIGQVLRIPVKAEEESQASKPVASLEPEYYTIKSGDNPWKIAKQFRVKFDDLLKLNDLDEGKARSLKPGDVLRVK